MVYELGRLRCNLCGEVFTAPEPEGVGAEKYDETTAAMIALLKYGSGLPFHRLEKLEQLRLLEAGIDIYVADAPSDTIGVDTEQDLRRAEGMLMSREASS